MDEYHRDLDDLIEIQDEVDPEDRDLEHEGCQGPRRDYEHPHGDKVADHAELRIPSRSEYSADDGGIDGTPEDIV